jgi:Ni/Co efflux regulator RcnB
MELSMKRTVIVSAVMAVCLTGGGPAFAQGRGNRDGARDSNDRGRNEQMQGRDQQSRDSSDRVRDERMQRNGHDDRRGPQARQPERRDYQGRAHYDQQGRAHYDQRREGRGAGPNHAFYRGERLPVQYRHRQYVVEDWRGHRLSAPPRGYHWVQTGADYVLVAIATGVILQLLLAN